MKFCIPVTYHIPGIYLCNVFKNYFIICVLLLTIFKTLDSLNCTKTVRHRPLDVIEIF